MNDQGQGAASRAVASPDDVRSMLANSRAVQSLREETAIEVARGKATADLLTKQGAQWVKDASPVQLEAFARACIGLGLNPLVGEAYLIHGGLYIGIQGRRKRAIQTGEFAGEGMPRLLTAEEREIFGVRDGDVARIVEVWRNSARLPGVGVGIVRRVEIEGAEKAGKDRQGNFFHPIARDPEGMAAKRAASRAYRVAFADIDLPTADTDGDGPRARVIDAESGDVLSAAARVSIAAPAEPAQPPPAPPVAQPSEPIEVAVRRDEEYAPPPPPTLRQRVAMAALSVGDPSPTDDDLLTIFGGCPVEALEAECGITDRDAEAIAAAVWAYMIREGTPVSVAASRVHVYRAEQGLSFVPDAIAVDDPTPGAQQDDQPAGEPDGGDSAPQRRGKQARLDA